jgi:Bacterial Ig domain
VQEWGVTRARSSGGSWFAATLCAALAGMLLGPGGSAASAPVASQIEANSSEEAPVPLSLHATSDQDAPLSFSVTSPPAHGSVSPIGQASCSFSPGLTDCTAPITYEPDQGFTGSDAFDYQATDGTLSSPAATVTVNVTAVDPTLPAAAVAAVGAPFTLSASGVASGARVDFGDATPLEDVASQGDGTATVAHTFGREGTFAVRLTNPSGAEATTTVAVLLPGPSATDDALVAPGSVGSVSADGLSATLALPAGGSAPAFLFAAAYQRADADFQVAQTTTIGAYDLRVVGAGAGATAVVRFRVAPGPNGETPVLVFFDPRTNRFEPVSGSATVPDSLTYDPALGTLTLVFDATSRPSVTGLTGTRFAALADPKPRVAIRGLHGCPPPRSFGVAVKDANGVRRTTVSLDGHRLSVSVRHRFRVRLPTGLRPGVHVVSVRAVDTLGAVNAVRARLRACE